MTEESGKVSLTEERFRAFVSVALRAADVLYSKKQPAEWYSERLAEELKRLSDVAPYLQLAKPDDR